MVILDPSNLLNQPHGGDGCFTMSVLSVAIEHTDEVEIQNCWKMKLYSAKFAGGSMILRLLNHKDFRWKTQQISFL
jgi:hypothetical protein